MTEETWKPVPGFPNYQIAPSGVVRLVRTGSILPVYRDHKKRLFVNLVREGQQFRRVVKLLRSAAYPELRP